MKKRFVLFVFLVSTLAGGLFASWLTLGCWWKSGEPCSLSPNPFSRPTIEPPWLLPFGTKVFANEGSVHFSPVQQAIPSHELIVEIAAPGCNDTPCTQVFERTGSLSVNLDDQSIRLTSRFAIRHFGFGPNACSPAIAICGGAGLVDFRTGELPDGIYQVWLGPNKIGEIAIPFDKLQLSLYSPFPSSATLEPTNSLYPPPLSPPAIAYPAPVDALPSLATPYPEPILASPAVPSSPTPVAAGAIAQPVWYSPVITIGLPIPATEAIVTAEWISSTRLVFETLSARSSGSYWADLDSGFPVVSTPQPAASPNLAYSASSAYSVQCGSPLQMNDVADQTAIGQANVILNPNAPAACDFYVSWAGDQLAAFTGGVDGDWGVYLWRPDGSMPFRIGSGLVGARAPVWSPDHQLIAFLNFSDNPTHEMQLVIADQNGKLALTIPAEGAPPSSTILWLSPQVIALSRGEAGWLFYSVPDGGVLFTWSQVPGIVLNQYNKFPVLSPDGRWFLVERSGANSDDVSHKIYSLYNVQNRQEIPLYDQPWHGLVFSGWAPRGNLLYLLHIPFGPDAAPDADLPYGLLAYHLVEGRFETLVENAQLAYWNTDYSKVFVYVFNPNGEIGARLSAGVWEQVHRQVKGSYLITDPPNQYDFLIYPISLEQMAPATWSPDGEMVAFFTARNEVVLMDLAGQTQLVASQVGLGRSDFTRLLAWSPDGSRLVVSDRGTAWVVTLPEAGGR